MKPTTTLPRPKYKIDKIVLLPSGREIQSDLSTVLMTRRRTSAILPVYHMDPTEIFLPEDAKGFCIELAKRANKNGEPVPMGKPRLWRFTDYPSRTVAPQRAEQAVLGKYDWTDQQSFAREAKAEAAKGPDFAGGYAILTWSCGTWCANA